MSNPINSLVVRSQTVNRRKFFAKGLMIAFALLASFALGSEAKAQSYLPVETQVYLDLARVCMQRGDDYCALKALQNAARISPQLARDPELVRIARILYARVEANNSGGESNYAEYKRCMDNASSMSGVNRIRMEATCRQWLRP